MEHYFLAPSSAARWRYCPASPALGAMFPEAETDASREGTASHWYAQQRLSQLPWVNPHAPVGIVPPIGTTAANGIVLTREMTDGAMVYVNDVDEYLIRNKGDVKVYVEMSVKCPSIHPEHCGGTPDCWAVFPVKRRIVIWDYKFGHKEVDPVENDQLLSYTSGIIDLLGLTGIDDQLWTVEFRIVQPRCYTKDGPIRTWSATLSSLRGHLNQLHAAATMALAPNPPTVSGSHCLYCPARGNCVAARQAAMSSVDVARMPAVEPMTPESVSFELGLLERAAEAIKARTTVMEEQAIQFLRVGKPVPGYEMSPVETRLVWKSEIDPNDIDAMGKAFGIALRKDDFITPTQARAKGIDESIISAYAHRPNGGMKLKRQDANRIIRILSNNPIN